MSTTPPAEGAGDDEVTQQEANPAADEASDTAAEQGEGRYASGDGADPDAGPDAATHEQGAPGGDAASEPAAETGAKAGPEAGGEGVGRTDVAGADEPAGPEEAPSAPSGPATETLHGCPLVDSLGSAVVHANRDDYGELMTALKADGYDLMVGVCGVDYLSHSGRQLPEGISPERFEVVVELARVQDRSRLRVRCQVPAGDPVVPSLFDLWAGSEAHERETYDMFGISFAGHPDPSRILMPEDWEGHPLRKDYASGRIPVQFKESPSGR